ncbi:MAG: PDDEXK nuclease domain-containing protein [Bifidobacteriaceae bacterium]|jgi:predicted nuclease of restriction endonuclease-like (RecB) superfamily|nr:PDDEXK nuclease domain-containing protein [Bifidobacteriaceae bacterium]
MSDIQSVAKGEQALGDDGLYEAAARIIEDTRAAIAYHANVVSVVSNWRIGALIHVETLHRGRGDYGEQILATLSQKLMARYGRGYDESSLNRMVKFAKEFPEGVVRSLPPVVSWSHVKELLPLKSAEIRVFYVEEIGAKNLSVRDLREAIGRKDYERREIANAQVPQGSAVPADVFKDPVFLDALGLSGSYLEADLEQAVLHDLEHFLLEVGRGLTFVRRQVRMPMGTRDYHLDLLLYSRPLRRLVAVELKIGEFIPEYFGQMRFYLKWLDKHEREAEEDAPIGLILCTSADREQVELMELHKDNIVVAEYWTELLPKKELEDRLRVILRQARERAARRALPRAPADTNE